MAKATSNGRSGNLSEAIRAALLENPTATSRQIIEGLAAKGIKAAPSLVYYVKSKDRHAKHRAKRARVAETNRKNGVANPLELVLRVKDLAREVGGMKPLKQLVDLLAE